MSISGGRVKIAVLFNIIAPAKVPVYSGLAAHFNMLLLHGGMESNRTSWHAPEKKIIGAKIKQVWSWQLELRKMSGKIRDRRHLHITPGFIFYLLGFHPDVVVSNEMGFRTLQALIYGTLMRKPVWVWWGGSPHTESTVGGLRRAMRFLISRWAKHWFSYGITSTEYLVSIGIPRDRIVQIQNSVDETQYTAIVSPKFDIKPRPVILHVGQFVRLKGIHLLLHAAAVLQREGQKFSMLLLGSGPDRQALEDLAKKLNLENIHFHSSLKPEEMSSVYRSGDCLVFPSLGDVWGTVANEAVLCGIPVLCSKYAGCAPDFFTEESIFDPENSEEFVAKLRRAVEGTLPQPDASNIRTTPEIVDRMVSAIEGSIKPSRPMHSQSERSNRR
jgi:glycosyltransferase involved in cell wall biosynthesis